VLESGLMHSLSTVLLHEMERFNKLLEVMKRTLVDLQKALKGLVVLSADLDHMFSSLIDSKVPALWEGVAYPSLKPLGSWVKDLVKRVEFVRHWLVRGLPSAFWLSGFFFPQGFMTGVLQTHARKYNIPIDTLNFEFCVLDKSADDLKDGPEDGVYVYGLFMDGARWSWEDDGVTDPARGEMFSVIPPIWFLPKPDYETPEGSYSCPLYKTSVRAGTLSTTGHSTNFVLSVDLPSQEAPSQWVLRGVALLCQLDA
jgi:dynein heavy chain